MPGGFKVHGVSRTCETGDLLHALQVTLPQDVIGTPCWTLEYIHRNEIERTLLLLFAQILAHGRTCTISSDIELSSITD